ncbi:hypothetical protein ALC60_13589 [Trachymyrmex zeteki]|uniref:DUF8207 domain-containing protein n=1 Tax=Mycetomoellerius zeteki TaxID=64791 RepID=A0A151WHU2_9HYME|nr:hypothetical protein ALC60_13589 [Trachymyrmex zeteki]
MRFVRMIKVTNLDGKVRIDKEMRKHSSMLPTSIRTIVCGPSNCGKTNVLVSLLESPHGVRFENVYVYSKSLQQPKYQYLTNLLTPIEEIGYFTFSNNSDVIPPNEALPNSIFIFDDVACDKQNAIREYFAMGRHAHVDCFYLCQEPRDLSYEYSHTPSVEEVFEVVDEPLVTSIRHLLQTSEGQEKLQTSYGPLGQKYLKAVLSGKKAVNIDMYGVYFSNEGTMLDDKRIALDKNDDIIINGKRYKGIPGQYELIFMKFHNENICTDDDMHTYKSILLTTNAYRRGHSADSQVLDNKRYKYKNIIATLVLDKKVGTGINKRSDIPRAMTLNDNKIDYIH